MKLFSNLLCLLFIASSFQLYAQKNVAELVESKRPQLDNLPEAALARAIPGNPSGLDLKEIKQYQLYSIDKRGMSLRKNKNRDLLKLKLAYTNKTYVLELVKKNLFGNEGKVTLASNGNEVDMLQGDYYWGMVKGKTNSMAAISVFEDNIEGLITIDGETFNFGKLKDEPYHIMYRADDVSMDQPECLAETLVEDLGNTTTTPSIPAANSSSIGSVGIYYEVDHDIYLAKNSSVTETTNFITAILNEVAIVYANESINLYISEIKVWDVVDPYSQLTSAGTRLDAFRDRLNGNYNGDLAHLISFDGGGGLAYINVLCNDFYGVGYSSIDNSYNTFPTYSWTVMVLAHELGHNLGSPHTHACAWNGNNTPLDGCGTQAGYGDSSCSDVAPIPSNGGTVMSYCHLTSAGINLSNGFGAQPGDLIRSKIVNAANIGCLIGCSVGSACDDGNVCTTNDAYDVDCNCVGTALPDSDNDGVCDTNDICPGGDDTADTDGDGTPDFCDTCNDNLVGTACDDGDDCTTNDVYDANCNCAGVSADSDNDGVCDAVDTCPGGDDLLDENNNGTPDACEVSCFTQTTSFSNSTLTHVGSGAKTTTLSFTEITKDVQFSINEINSKLNGKASRRYTEQVTVSYVDGNGTNKVYGTYSGQSTNSINVNINEIVQSVSIRLADIYSGNTTTQMSVSISSVSICAEPCQDDDNDGVCNAVDVCAGFDDSIDTDGDGVPDGCDNCNNLTSNFEGSSLTNSGTGSTSTIVDLVAQTDISFTVSQLGAKTGGKPSARYVDEVTISYVDGTGTTKNYGTYSGSNQNAINVRLSGTITQITVTLANAYGGAGTVSVNLSAISGCQISEGSFSQASSRNRVIPELSFEAYPNPFNESIQINVNDENTAKGSIRIVDYYGRVIQQFNIEGQKIFRKTIDTSDWPGGLYYIEYKTGNQFKVEKIIKAKL